MEESLFLHQDILWRYMISTDNLMIAKLLHDEGKPLPKETVFFAESEYLWDSSLFNRAIYQLFGVYCVLKWEDDSIYQITVKDPDAMTWHKLKKRARSYPLLSQEMEKDEERIISRIKDEQLFFDMYIETQMTFYGFKITVHGYYGTFGEYFEKLVKAKKALKGIIKKWEARLEELKKGGKNTDRNMERRTEDGRS